MCVDAKVGSEGWNSEAGLEADGVNGGRISFRVVWTVEGVRAEQWKRNDRTRWSVSDTALSRSRPGCSRPNFSRRRV